MRRIEWRTLSFIACGFDEKPECLKKTSDASRGEELQEKRGSEVTKGGTMRPA